MYARTFTKRHVARTCVQPATFKRTRQRESSLIYPILFVLLPIAVPPLVRNILFFSLSLPIFSRRGPEGSPTKRSCRATRESGTVGSYGACAPPGIPRREIRGNFSLPDTTMYPSIPPLLHPSPKKCTSTTTLPPVALHPDTSASALCPPR